MKSNRQIKKIGIIGAGPSGLAVAVSAGRALADSTDSALWRIDLIERNSEPGKKLLATGNGKCNLTNRESEDFLLCRDFFRELGIIFTEEDEGRVYPHSRQAAIVRDTLFKSANDLGVRTITDKRIKKIMIREGDIIDLVDENGKLSEYHRLIIATGGKAGIQFGSDGDGLRFARDLGIKTKSVQPALVPMIYGNNPGFDLSSLKGVRAKVGLILRADGRIEKREKGEIQFTQYGLSGICIFNLSRYLRDAVRVDNKLVDCVVEVDFAPDYSFEDLVQLIGNNLQAGLGGIVNGKIESLFLKSGLDPESDPKECGKYLKAFPVNIHGTKGWKEAQITSGGITLSEIDMGTMASKSIKNLFFAGEILDYDGPCGGYNLTWAWKTGIMAGLSVVNSITSNML